MALAQRYAGVRRGYRAKTVVVERNEPTMLQRAVVIAIGAAREMREFVEDEIVYATIDTLRVMRYVRYQLGFRPRRENKRNVNDVPQIAEVRAEAGVFAIKPVRVGAKQ